MCKPDYPTTIKEALELSTLIAKIGGADEDKLRKRCVEEGKDRKTILLLYGPPNKWD